MDFNDLFSPWMQLHIADLFSQDIDAETQRRIGVTADEFRHKYAVASLEIGISRSLFLSTWQSLKNHDKSLTDRTELRYALSSRTDWMSLIMDRHHTQGL